MEIHVKMSLISIFSIFFWFSFFNHDVVTYVDFTSITVSNTSTRDLTNQVTHRIFNTNL